MKQPLKFSELVAVGLMLFALFFGAGNMIFPPALGQGAGSDIWIALFGFIVSGVGLPLLGVIVIALRGGDLNELAGHIHPIFALVFGSIIYLCLGVFVSVPRTATVAYEMAVAPFLSESLANQSMLLVAFSFMYFILTFYLALNPSKLIDRIGKLLTPILLSIIVIIVIKALMTPMGEFGEATEAYASPLFKGFIDGYFTLDGLAALVFGNVVIVSLRERGITNQKSIAKITIFAAFIAAAGLLVVYVALAFLGASSVSLGMGANGGVILTNVVNHLFGNVGLMLLGVAIACACLTTSVGIVAACGTFFSTRVFPNASYKQVVLVFCMAAFFVANIGLTQLNAMALPILIAIYPIGIVLIMLSLVEHYVRVPVSVYVCGMIGAFFISIFDAVKSANFSIGKAESLLANIPLFDVGMGWLVPAIIGMIIGYMLSVMKKTA
ncbi:branched-chain amino acid transport system II carrier protein [Priestia taiwanensis]|uniref:Branched-chain amino acid transport system carrier protein n=1 Tax=Priestia taiwanensis TaxID=1347902 RepID=A0A917AQJ8_9BACI|nr:branched-chain amino acid transport system II carrier protein [Priestia taiwanensis]MBM7363181.1 LIVCS family branched-chain amino acid:cation transporter [Priestia taiwanensis]GGE68319.1 branched-chain amino acid transport system carrier protein [Priestia taiwanensis]